MPSRHAPPALLLAVGALVCACSSPPASTDAPDPVRPVPKPTADVEIARLQMRRDSLKDLGRGRALLVPAARIGDDRINECSGLAYAGGAWWMHNDSGDGPHVFASASPYFESPTRFVVPGAEAVDWEELAVLGGDLLVCDIGDNARKREDLTLYRLRVDLESVETVATYPIAYPDGKHDAEGVYVWGGRVHIVIKNRGEDATGVYRFDDLRDASELGEGERNVPERIATVNLPRGEQVTAADSSASGHVVLLTYSQALFYSADDVSGDPIAAFNLNARQCEAVAWSASGIVIANEQRDIYVIDDPLGCDLEWWLPPRPSVTIPRLSADASHGDMAALPVEHLREGESVRMGVFGEKLVIDAVLQVEGDLIVSEGRLGTSAIVALAAEPRIQPADSDRLFAVIAPPDQPLTVIPFSMFGPPANQDLTGVSVSGAGDDEHFHFRLEVDAAAVFPDGLPNRFLFQFVGNGFRKGPDEPLLSALDIYSLMRPFTWADVTVR